MGLFEKFSHAIYKEPVLVWALGLYATGVAVAAIVPQYYDKNRKDVPANPPTLKEVMAGVQKKLGH